MWMDALGLNPANRWTSQVQRLCTAVIRRAAATVVRRERVEGLPASVITSMIRRVLHDEQDVWRCNLADHRTIITIILQYYNLSRYYFYFVQFKILSVLRQRIKLPPSKNKVFLKTNSNIIAQE